MVVSAKIEGRNPVKATEQTHEFLEIVDLLKNRLEQLQEEIPEIIDDYHRLFLYFVGEQFEGVSPEKIQICDQKGDQKIDFYDAGEDRFVVYQCKLPELERLEQKESIANFGPNLVNEAEDVLTFLTDSSGTATGSEAVRKARNMYRSLKQNSEQENQIYRLEVVLACFGRLTAAAMERLNELQNRWRSDNGEFEVKVVNYDAIAQVLSFSLNSHKRPREIKLNYREETSVSTNEWGYALVPAIELYRQFDEYKMALFDLNVRYYLGRSSVNRQIMSTLNTTLGQKRFHLLNNGVTIACDNHRFSKNHLQLTLNRPQIINGCQTVISIFHAYNQMDVEFKRRNFEANCYVPVRIIQTQDDDLLAEVVTASNNQNKMSPRNLRSNSRIQRILQQKFDHLEHKYFYERKDGEFKSIREYGHGRRSKFKRKHYQYSSRGYREIDNEDLAKAWLSFIGFSKDALERINAFELIDEGGRYEWLFEKCPSAEHWDAITLGAQVSFNEENFEPRTPAPSQYLLSYLIFKFVRAYLPSHQANKAECIKRLKSMEKITDSSPAEEINTALMEDEGYVLNQILYNMKEVIVELYAWILIKAYGPLNADTADKILQLPGIHDVYKIPDFKLFVNNLTKTDSPESLERNVLFICFEFIKEAVTRWKSIHEQEYLASQRRTRYLHSAKVVQQMKESLSKTNEDTRRSEYEWKPPKIDFLQSLPGLSSD